jgi:predicted transcriptional regulator
MSDRRVPAWYTALGLGTQGDRVYDVFVDVLHHLPISSSELARRIGISQPAVSRWSSGSAHASLEQMEKTLDVVDDCISEMAERVNRAREVFALVDRAIVLSECRCVPSVPFCDTCSLRSTAVRDELKNIQVRLAGLLQVFPHPRDWEEGGTIAS